MLASSALAPLLVGLLSHHPSCDRTKEQFAQRFTQIARSPVNSLDARFEYNDVVFTIHGPHDHVVQVANDLHYGLQPYFVSSEIDSRPEQGFVRYRMRHVSHSQGASEYFNLLTVGFNPLGYY